MHLSVGHFHSDWQAHEGYVLFPDFGPKLHLRKSGNKHLVPESSDENQDFEYVGVGTK